MSLTFPAILSNGVPLVVALGALLLASATTAYATPPNFPDADHVVNGCHLSAVAYLARFTAAHPTERGSTVRIIRIEPNGRRGGHSVALVTWKGNWWCRDEFIGVFPLDRPVAAHLDPDTLTGRASDSLENFTRLHTRRGGVSMLAVPDYMPPHRRLNDVATARRLLPVDSTLYWIRVAGAEIPFVFFRPAPGWVALYDPMFGTGAAETVSTDDAGIAALIAGRFGYRVTSIRADAPMSSPSFASATR